MEPKLSISTLSEFRIHRIWNFSWRLYLFKGIALKRQKHVWKWGLGDRINYYPNELSGGQRQKVAAATAIVKNPLLILADELTGNLDTKTGLEIINLLEETIQNQDATIVRITFDMEIAELSHQIFKLKWIIK